MDQAVDNKHWLLIHQGQQDQTVTLRLYGTEDQAHALRRSMEAMGVMVIGVEPGFKDITAQFKAPAKPAYASILAGGRS